jgi:TfoX/Sxy family transcriptional regulator of competence genes
MAKWTGAADPDTLAARLRAALGKRGGLSEKRMFGGICFLLRGNMLCGAGKNGFMFRVDRARLAAAERLPGGSPVVMQGRAMAGFFWVDPAAADAKVLGRWLALAESYVAALPAKSPKATRPRKRRGLT